MTEGRLSKSVWVDAGLRALAADGVSALKADVLAKSLGVSRGSFYWHFADVDGFHKDVLAAWERVATADIIATVDREGGDAVAKLHRLARVVFSAEGALERQVRAWASQQKTAELVQDRVDRKRIAYVKRLLLEAGHRSDAADRRARVLYLTLVGQYSTGRRFSLEAHELKGMVDLLIATD